MIIFNKLIKKKSIYKIMTLYKILTWTLIGGITGSLTTYTVYSLINENDSFHHDFNPYSYYAAAKYGFYIGGTLGFMKVYLKE